MPWVDRYDEGTDAQAWHRGADVSGQRDGVVVELLGYPHLANAGVVGASGLVDRGGDMVGGTTVGIEHDTSGHTDDNNGDGATDSVQRTLSRCPPQLRRCSILVTKGDVIARTSAP